MTKNRFDNRTWVEIVGDLVSARTSQGDSIKLVVKYNGSKKPNVWLEFSTYDSEKKYLPNIEEITDWVDATPYYEIMDDSTGKPIPGDTRRGSSSWDEYINVRFGPLVKSIVESGGRVFSYKEDK